MLIKHYTATVAILAILSYIVAIYGAYPEEGAAVPRHVRFARVIQRVAAKAAGATLVLLTVLFFTVVDHTVPSDRFVSDHAGEWGASLYMTVFYVYLGAASAVCAYQWALATANASLRHLRVGLGMMTFAMFIGVGCTVSRTLFLWISVAEQPTTAFAQTFDKATEAAQVVLFAFFAIGAAIPAFAKGWRRARLWRAQVALHPLWRDLMAAFPDQPFAPPAPLARELTSLRSRPRTCGWTGGRRTSPTRWRSCATTCRTRWRLRPGTRRARGAAGGRVLIRAALAAKADEGPRDRRPPSRPRTRHPTRTASGLAGPRRGGVPGGPGGGGAEAAGTGTGTGTGGGGGVTAGPGTGGTRAPGGGAGAADRGAEGAGTSREPSAQAGTAAEAAA